MVDCKNSKRHNFRSEQEGRTLPGMSCFPLALAPGAFEAIRPPHNVWVQKAFLALSHPPFSHAPDENFVGAHPADEVVRALGHILRSVPVDFTESIRFQGRQQTPWL